MSANKALLIDDEPDILELLSITLNRMGIDCDTAENVKLAKQFIVSNQYSICLTDMKLPDGDGLEVVKFIQLKSPATPVAMITAHGNMETAIEAMKLGAFDFISKPVDLTSLRSMVANAIKVNSEALSRDDSTESISRQFIGETQVMNSLKKMILKVAKSQAPIYIRGESGTGKEMVAKLIHQHGPRSDKPFIAVNCGAIPSELMESEFFGHKKGSFTGATSDKVGLFKAADGGTLFLDEIADLPLSMQVKLLRAIQERAIRPIGADEESQLNVRVLSASHKNLGQMVEDGQFRQDLFYRINVIEIEVPSLRERALDIPALSRYFIGKLSSRNKHHPPTITEEAIEKLMHYSFPGNIRELENILERTITLNFDETIEADDIHLVKSNQQKSNDDLHSERGEIPLDEYLESIEKKELLNALDECKGNKTAAAEVLGISFRAIRYKLKKLGID